MQSDSLSVENTRAGRWRSPAALFARVLLGGLFIYMGLNKALDPVDFLKLVRQYDLFTNHYLLNLTAACLPWFEVVCGVLLVAGVAVRGTALLLILMLIPFTIVVADRAMDIAQLKHLPFCAVRFDCGCGGGEVNICRKILENTGLLFLSVWFVARGKSPESRKG